MKNFKLLFIIMLFIGCIYVSSCSTDPIDSVHVGMKYEKVVYLLGEPDEEEMIGISDKSNETYKACYWFQGASSKDEAKTNTEKGIPVSYVMILFATKDEKVWRIKEKEDIVNGIWGVS